MRRLRRLIVRHSIIQDLLRSTPQWLLTLSEMLAWLARCLGSQSHVGDQPEKGLSGSVKLPATSSTTASSFALLLNPAVVRHNGAASPNNIILVDSARSSERFVWSNCEHQFAFSLEPCGPILVVRQACFKVQNA